MLTDANIRTLATAVFSLVVLYLLIKTDRRVPDDVRCVVYRLGKYAGILGPGRHIVVPFVDKVTEVRLDHQLPSWRGLTEAEITDALERQLNIGRQSARG